MNPVRAHLVKEPENYLWSSHGAYLGYREFVWLTTNHGLSKFADNVGEGRLKYLDYIFNQEAEDSLKELREGFIDGQILGDDDFLEDIRSSQEEASPEKISIQTILEALCQVYNVDQIALASPLRSEHLSLIRGAAALLARQKGLTLEELAKTFKRDGSSISRLMQRFLQRHASCIDLQNQYRQLEEVVSQFADMQV
jgi:hypothetical protein